MFAVVDILPTTYYWKAIKMVAGNGLLIGCIICIFITQFTQAGVSGIIANQVPPFTDLSSAGMFY